MTSRHAMNIIVRPVLFNQFIQFINKITCLFYQFIHSMTLSHTMKNGQSYYE